ncbi:MAG: transglycosylase SLT domain-containing protein [Proteobacteria bacterium]|nr:transglycosylase SLT domain-containing protein [Pseudomonadota bacterium]
MFLFTTPAETPRTDASTPVADAMRRAARRSGVAFDYLMTTAKRESALDPTARAGTSSARGLFQFVEQTWLKMVQEKGAEIGLGAEAAAVTDRSGRPHVADAATRQRILALRDDPAIASELAAHLARDNHAGLTQALGREPQQGELYIAHFLGLSGAIRLIRGAERTPDASASDAFPQAAVANRGIFRDRSGRERSLAEVHSRLVSGFGREMAVTSASQPVAANEPTGNPFHRLFHSDAASPGRRAVINNFLPLARRAEAAGEPLDIRPKSTVSVMRSRG